MKGNTVAGASQGSAYPECRSTYPPGVSQNGCLNCAKTGFSCACRSSDSASHDTNSAYRPRIKISDARLVRRRVEDHPAAQSLRGAQRHVLAAALWLLCDHKRLTDDRVHLRQIIWWIVDQAGHRYDPKTVGRALAQLTHAGLLTYTPARGRGRCAVIAIPQEFAGDIQILERDHAGNVIITPKPDTESVTFSRPRHSSIEISKNPPTPRRAPAPTNTTDCRPTEVAIDPTEVRRIRETMPAIYRELPSARLRWLMAAEITRYLARGWRPDQIVSVLAAPLPPCVDRPWKLARWRLTQNLIGAGPRLAPRQREWDRAQITAEHAAYETAQDAALTEIAAACDNDLIEAICTAVKSRFGTISDRRRAIVHAARMARREHPELPLQRALRRWVNAATTEPAPAVIRPVPDGNAETSPECRCVSCSRRPGRFRPELPIPDFAVVCDDCWTALADPDLLEGSAA